MKKLFLTLLLALAGCQLLPAQTEMLLKTSSNNQITEDVAFGSGRTLTIKSGATFGYDAGASFSGSASEFLSDISAQPLDADLTAIAALMTTSTGRGFLTLADAAAGRTYLSLVIGTDVQAFDTDLAIYASITPSANVQTILGAANYAAIRTALGLGSGDSPTFTDVTVTTEAYDATGWNGDNTVPTKDAVRDKMETLAPAGTWVLLGSATAASSAQINVDNVVTSDYDVYKIEFDRLVPATNGATGEMILRSSSPSNIGGTYKRGRRYVGINGSYFGFNENVTGTNGFPFETQSNDAASFLDGEVKIKLKTNSASKAVFMHWIDMSSFDGAFYESTGGGYNSNTTAVAGFGFAYTSGNVVSGTISVYGLKK